MSCASRLAVCVGLCLIKSAFSQFPHNQDSPPGPALTVEQATAKMKVPPGLEVRAFASEPDVLNPVAMTFDARGRVWIAESLEYPRFKPGPGQDRIRILEDTDADGRADKIKVFADGLNIPSGIAIGHGGVFVANSPDLLFLRDADGDDVADSREILITGFGRHDTHELPSSLTWGPDGWLYGLNGVFNPAVINHQGKTHRFTCALWRYHPRTKAFEVFCEGTSNPWGLDYDEEGSFFVSACVIDHLWHLTESGYYHRQAGAYPPHTWKIESIVNYAHQKAAYSGLCWFDSPAFGDAFQGKWFMGNIHGGCINCDSIHRSGASYAGVPNPDPLTANDAWFMPVSQKVGPDGNLWIMDWYDRYHCYQDARRDSAGIDRARGRIYRLVPKGFNPLRPIDYAKLPSTDLVARLSDPNIFVRRTARRILVERNEQTASLEMLALDSTAPLKTRMEVLWTRISQGNLSNATLASLMTDSDAVVRAWGVRVAGDQRVPDSSLVACVGQLASDPDPRVRLQVAIACRKLMSHDDAAKQLLAILEDADRDESGLLPRIAWRNLEALLPAALESIRDSLQAHTSIDHPGLTSVLGRLLDRCLDVPKDRQDLSASIFSAVVASKSTDDQWRQIALSTLFDAARTGSAPIDLVRTIARQCKSQLDVRGDADPRDRVVALGLGLLVGEPNADNESLQLLKTEAVSSNLREQLFNAWAVFSKPSDQQVAQILPDLLAIADGNVRQAVLRTAARLPNDNVAPAILGIFDRLSGDERGPALNVLVSRPAWAVALLDAIDAKQVPREALNSNQIRALAERKDAKIQSRVERIWGTVRVDDDPKDRQVLAAKMRRALSTGNGDPEAGKAVYARVCSQCHRLGQLGYEVGPDISRNGTSNLDALVSNIFDPNLVIGRDYQPRIVLKTDGQIVTGLVVEESKERIVLKVAGGQKVVIDRQEIDEMRKADASLMPEGLESQLSEQDFRDLVAFLLHETSR